MDLEAIYEAQLYPKQKDELNEKLQRLNEVFNAAGLSFVNIKLQYERRISGEHKDFYAYQLKRIEKLEEAFYDLKETFEENFVKYPNMNHPNRETRKDLI